MIGTEFALSIIASIIAAVLYHMLRNPPPPVPKNESKNLLQDGQELIRKVASRILPSKKEDNPRPTLEAFKRVIGSGHDRARRESLQRRFLSTRRQSSLKKAFILEFTPNGA